VWDYISKFTEWQQYFHKVIGVVEGKKIPIPFNLNSIEILFPKEFADKITSKLIEKFGYGLKIPILKLKENQDTELSFLAKYIYDNVFAGYTFKQWNLMPEELDYSVTSRIPIYISRDDRYFQDNYQGIPKNGYAKIFEKMLSNKNIHIMLNTDFKDVYDAITYEKMIYTGPIDYFFENQYGRLPYRSLEFDFQTLDVEHFQETSQVNYPNNYDYTRITEFKHFVPTESSKTTIAFEYPKDYIEGENEPYYPIPRADNQSLFDRYNSLAKELYGRVYFAGRLAEYKYYNMDQAVASALMLFDKLSR
jgi:UDP-galactopyranose mutase